MRLTAFRNFPWPRPPKALQNPIWEAGKFMVGSERHEVLAFDSEESAWTPELTALHEEEAGSDHPIDRASRKLAVQSLREFIVAEQPVILDVGCSSGYVLREIKRALPNSALLAA